jgi:hypothetical protein
MKLVRKVRVGSRLIRRYAAPQTPFERVRACADADPQKVAALEQVLKTTDPFALSQRIDRHLERLWALATRATRTPREAAPRPPRPRASTPWRGWTFSRRAHSQKPVITHSLRAAGGSSRSDQVAIGAYKPNTEAGCSAETPKNLGTSRPELRK